MGTSLPAPWERAGEKSWHKFHLRFCKWFQTSSWILRPLCLPSGQVGCNYVTSHRLVSEERGVFLCLTSTGRRKFSNIPFKKKRGTKHLGSTQSISHWHCHLDGETPKTRGWNYKALRSASPGQSPKDLMHQLCMILDEPWSILPQETQFRVHSRKQQVQ